jgi:homoserine kinase
MVTLALALVTNGRAKPNLVHTCSATDRQFIEAARTNMTALEFWSEQYQSGDTTAEDVASEANAAAKIMRGAGPTDFALRQTQRLVIGMLSEYAKGVQLHEKHRDAGPTMYRAYGLANFAHAVLLRNRQPLAKLGCEVEPLL